MKHESETNRWHATGELLDQCSSKQTVEQATRFKLILTWKTGTAGIL